MVGQQSCRFRVSECGFTIEGPTANIHCSFMSLGVQSSYMLDRRVF